jgi:cytoskeleton protein RodZ
MLASGTGTVDIGTQLRESREARRLSIEAVSRATRVQPRMLAAIEQNDASALPPRPFGRGFVRAYAREVGLDPDRTVRDYFGQFAPAPITVETETIQSPGTSSPDPSRRRLAVAAGILLIVFVGGGLLLARHSLRAPRDASVVGTSGSAPTTAAPVSPDTTHRPVAGPPATPPKPEAPPRAIDVVINTTAQSWIAATADGQRVVYRLMNAGERATIRATKDVTIRAGNAGGVTWTINGRDAGVFGQSGAVRNATVTLENAASIR